MTKICFLAQFPPPMHGLSKAVQTLFNSRLNKRYGFTKIDITHNFKILSTIYKLLTTKADIIYFTPSQTRGGNLRDLFLLKFIHLRHKRCIAHIHGGYYRTLVDKDLPLWQKQMNYNAVSRLAGGIVLGKSLRWIFEGMLSDDRIFVCPNCVDDEFLADSIEDKLALMRNDKKLHILYLSNFIETKGYMEVLTLAQMAKQREDDDKFAFHFAGKFFSEDVKKYFMDEIANLKNVQYHGIVGGQGKVDLLLRSNIFILLTRYPNEGQPISILEAMGNGMAIVTTNHAGIPEIAGPENGFVCNKNHIELEAVYKFLLDCYQNRERLCDVCSLNYKTTKQRYTEKQYISNMDKIFETVCNRIK